MITSGSGIPATGMSCCFVLSVCIALCFPASSPGQDQHIILNEFMSSNNDFQRDEDGDDSDWIELLNTSDMCVNLSEYSLSDNLDKLTKWSFPDTMIGANEYLVVFASGKDRVVSGEQLHTNFKIEASGEDLILAHRGALVQHIPPVALSSNVSYGGYPDGSVGRVIFVNPSPGLKNEGEYYDDAVYVNRGGGLYRNVFNVTLSHRIPAYHIRYTLDGDNPTSGSILYTAPLLLSDSLCSDANISSIRVSPLELYAPPAKPGPKCIILKSAVFDSSGRRASEIETHSYFIKELGIDHDSLPIISISAEHADLFDDVIGIMVPGIHWNSAKPNHTGNYFKRGDAWEKHAFVEFYEPDGTKAFCQSAGLRIHGGFTRRFPQKGFTLCPRNQYGTNEIAYRMFEDESLESFHRIVLRPFATSTYVTGIEDYVAQHIASTLDVEALATRPAVLYLNGEYWGVYQVQERFDEYYLEAHMRTHADSVDIILAWEGFVEAGDAEDYRKLYAFMEQADMTVDADYDTAKQWIDINNFIDYQLLEIFIANADWPANNMKLWRPRKTGETWRWIFYDGDASFMPVEFDGFENALSTIAEGWPTNVGATLFLRKLLESKKFRTRFINRLEYLLNNELSFLGTVPFFNEITLTIHGEIERQIDRFGSLGAYLHWLYAIGDVFDFLRNRQCEIVRQVAERFGIRLAVPNCPVTVSVKPNGQKEHEPCTMELYPNPSAGGFSLTFDAPGHGNAILSIINLLGQTLFTASHEIKDGHNRLAYTGSRIPPGLYMIRLQLGTTHYSTRLLIAR